MAEPGPKKHRPHHQQNPTTQETTPFPFMCLPKELRLQVYSYLPVTAYRPIDGVSPRRFGYWLVDAYPLSLLLVSRAVSAEATDSLNDKHSTTIFCRPNQQQKYRAIQTALQLGYNLDHAWLEQTEMPRSRVLPISSEVVNTAVQKILDMVPYSQTAGDMPLRLYHLRHFVSQTIIRLRRLPQIRLVVIVSTRPGKWWQNGYGPAARYVAFTLRDGADLWLLLTNLRNLRLAADSPGPAAKITTKVTVRGLEGDKPLRDKSLECGAIFQG